MQISQNFTYNPPALERSSSGPGVPVVHGLGALTASGLGPYAETAASILGSGFGGALIGMVAAHDKDGAVKGAAFAAGLAGVTEGFSVYRSDNRVAGAFVMAAGLGGMFWALRSFVHIRR